MSRPPLRPAITALAALLFGLALGCAPEPEPEPEPAPAVPEDLAYCDPVRDWDPAWTAFEDEVLVLLNEHRALGATCGLDQVFEPAVVLTTNPNLRCSARIHADDMGAQGYFSNLDLEGLDFRDRAAAAEYAGTPLGQNIGAAQTDAAQLVEAIMGNSKACSVVMNPDADEFGMGWTAAYEDTHWVQVLGASAS